MRITRSTLDDVNSRIHQDITVNLSGKETYVFSGWAVAFAAPNRDDDTVADGKNAKRCGLVAALYYSDGSKEVFYGPFNIN